MAGRFRRPGRAGGAQPFRLVLTLSPVEVEVVRDLLGELLELLEDGHPGRPASPSPTLDPDPAADATTPPGGDRGPDPDLPGDPLDPDLLGIGTSTRLPEDPVLARLFPDGYADDAEAAADFRRYTEPGLRTRKVAAARTVLATLQRDPASIELDEGEALAWLAALNDLRLAIGERLGVTEEWEDELGDLPDEDPRSYVVAVYDFLTFLQDSLVRELP